MLHNLVDGKRYVCQLNVGTDYAGEPIAAYWQTQPTDLGAAYIKKQITELHMRSSEGSMKVTVFTDGKPCTIQRNTFDNGCGYIDIPVQSNLARQFSIRFENIAGSLFFIYGGVDVQYEKEKR